jgi:hypothetical protein
MNACNAWVRLIFDARGLGRRLEMVIYITILNGNFAGEE